MGWFRQRARRWWSGTRPVTGTPEVGVDDADLHERVAELLARELGTVEHRSAAPTPVSPARIASWMTDNQFSYFVDNDGDLGGLWRGRLFYFFLFGAQSEILQVRGQWHRELAIERLEEVLDLCNEWNAERIWPKAYARVRDNGRVHVVAEVATDLEHGATDAQLSQILFCGLSTGSMLFDALDERYPDPAGAAP
ncbi:YbjN domain-containing protein [Cellulomonas sp. zg-ZUI222]|uniref:YbjN domain-containing protein n=1 Tax=Cellulomonas wangleii TaxID=2816956 RepID=A0ABX8DBV2_9CELL|nr:MULTISPECIES: YbjN domain-containing protein [Cellulomonas]MBO0900654.1 YbjN domain-containing protein [Cellulomonas sp. zg-ZUI22]MBO0921322.1 YbjN domain-containing protein [Cellulomonas wangleii]MBO0925738.1 YbjN domain-containing protein [Cellulomonas wangleii]QVI63737.1 YbjN domain-containing protein [Cellulomonas wangleii]